MEPNPISIKQTINAIIDDINGEFVFDENKLLEYLGVLEDYECWQPYFRLLSKCIDEQKFRKIDHYIKLARIHNLVFADLDTAAQVCARLIADLELSYEVFQAQVLAEVVTSGDYLAEASVLDRVFPAFSSKQDLISCLERLCFIFEKKRHNDVRLSEYYEKLINIDSNNIKALRYFKGIYIQSNEWEEVIRILQALHSHYERQNDKYLAAQEMATIYQYQMDLPQKALDTIQNLCGESPLDTTVIRYDAFSRLRDWQGCLDTLDTCLKKVDGSHDKSIIQLKMGELYERMGKSREAVSCYQASIRYNPELLESYERLIYFSLRDLDWFSTVRYMELLRSQIKNRNLAKKISLVCDGIKSLIAEMPSSSHS